MEKGFEKYENNILKIVTDELVKVREKFTKKDIVIMNPSLKIYNSGPKTYTSEIEIWFNRNDNLIDIIEFHVMKNGDFWIGDEDEFKQWLIEILEEVFTDN